MDLPSHDLSRKRKSPQDDVHDVDHVVNTSHGVPRSTNPKRPRLSTDKPTIPPRLFRRGRLPARPPPVDRLGSDVEDIGIVPNSAPGPSSGSLLNLRRRDPTPSIINVDSSVVLNIPIPIDATMVHIPSTQPYVSRHTLKELDLDVILRNPQLRHDLMFDHGLQFRPTSNRRKHQISNAYWNTVIREVETGCTCFSIDKQGNPLATPACVCSHIPVPPASPIIGYSPPLQVMTVRMPSRIRPLLTEFLEVLLLVIQPLQSISGMYVNPESFKSQMEEHSTQAKYIRSIFDPALIEQELKHDVFDLASLLRVIGATLKGHCAPMRDHAVEAMVRAAEACKPGGHGTKADAVNAVRACMDILELMKLDIANHQLQSLRISIARTSASYELSVFQATKGSHPDACRITRQWLTASYKSLQSRETRISHPSYAPDNIDFRCLGRNRQIYLSVLAGLTDLVFRVPKPRSVSKAGSSEIIQASKTARPLEDPETLYLDHARLRNITKDLGDIVATYMFLLLCRQLLYSSEWEDSSSSRTRPAVKFDEADLIKLKNEIHAISTTRVGSGLSRCNTPDQEGTKWATAREDIVLQVAKRAQEIRRRNSSSLTFSAVSSTATSPATTPATTPSTTPATSVASTPATTPATTPLSSPTSETPTSTLPFLCTSSLIGPPPNERVLSLARRWAVANVTASSSLYTVIHDRLHEAIFTGVVAQAYPGRRETTSQLFSSAIHTTSSHRQGGHTPLPNGMEPLADEIRALTDKISKVALNHLNVYLPMYEVDSFLEI